MAEELIFTVDDLTVYFDKDDHSLPIKIAGEWLDEGEAEQLATKILEKLGLEKELTALSPTAEFSGDVNRDLISVALSGGRAIQFRYAKGESQSSIETRRLRPERLLETADHNTVVFGTDLDRDEPRAYRLDRIKGTVSVSG